MTAYTSLRATEDGVLFYDQHLARFKRAAGAEGEKAFRDFAENVRPGAWSLRFDEGGLTVKAMPGSRLFDGMPAVLRPSPLAPGSPALEKPAPPGPYAPLRIDGVSVLLSSLDGGEIWESCSAAVLAFDGRGLIHPPDDRPRVRSTAEAHLRSLLPMRAAPVPSDCRALLLVNAVKGACLLEPPRSGEFPAALLETVRTIVSVSARR